MYDNIGTMTWVIQYTDTDRYAQGSLPTTSKVANAYISKIAGLYSILSLLESACQIYKLQKV